VIAKVVGMNDLLNVAITSLGTSGSVVHGGHIVFGSAASARGGFV